MTAGDRSADTDPVEGESSTLEIAILSLPLLHDVDYTYVHTLPVGPADRTASSLRAISSVYSADVALGYGLPALQLVSTVDKGEGHSTERAS